MPRIFVRLDKSPKCVVSQRKDFPMSKRPSSFRVTDVKRMVLAAENAGMKVASVEFEVKTGRIIVVPQLAVEEASHA